jgi:hypothetical protein
MADVLSAADKMDGWLAVLCWAASTAPVIMAKSSRSLIVIVPIGLVEVMRAFWMSA